MGLVQGRMDSLKLHSERIVTAIDTTTTASTVTAADGGTGIADVGNIPTLQNFIKKEYENKESAWGQCKLHPVGYRPGGRGPPPPDQQRAVGRQNGASTSPERPWPGRYTRPAS